MVLPRSLTLKVALGLLLAWNLALRLWFAADEPTARRWFDEQYHVANVSRLLETGEHRPDNFFYGAAGYLPQAWMLRALQGVGGAGPGDGFVRPGERDLVPAGYLLCRLVVVVYGMAGLWLVFLVGQAMFGPREGLLALLLTGASTRHLQASAVFKPDGLLVLCTLLAFLWTLRAVRSPRVGNHILCGVAIGLATATKLTGWTASIPLALAAVSNRHGAVTRGRRLLWLVAAAVTSVAVYLAFNPYLGATLSALSSNHWHYEKTSQASRLDALIASAGYLFDAEFLGPIPGAAAAAGALMLASSLLRGGAEGARRTERWLLLAYPLAFWLLYCATTSRAKPNQFVVVVPFAALWAAFALVAAWDRVADRLPARPRALAAAAAALLVAGVAAPASFRFAREQVVPTTAELVARHLQASLPEPVADRTVVTRAGDGYLPRHRARLEAAVIAVDSATEAARLSELADAVVLVGEADRGQRGGIQEFRPGLLRSRGPRLALVTRPLEYRGALRLPAPSFLQPRPRILRVPLPEGVAPGEIVSLRLRLSTRPGKLVPERALAGGAEVPFERSSASDGPLRFVSARFRVPERERTVALAFAPMAPPVEKVTIDLVLWSAPVDR